MVSRTPRRPCLARSSRGFPCAAALLRHKLSASLFRESRLRRSRVPMHALRELTYRIGFTARGLLARTPSMCVLISRSVVFKLAAVVFVAETSPFTATCSLFFVDNFASVRPRVVQFDLRWALHMLASQRVCIITTYL